MAADITASLRALDPHDPVRFDFSHLPRRHDERLRLRPEAGRLAMSAQRTVPSAAAPGSTVRVIAALLLGIAAGAAGSAPRHGQRDRCARGAGPRSHRLRRTSHALPCVRKRRARQASARSCGSARPRTASVTGRVARQPLERCDEIAWTPDGNRVGLRDQRLGVVDLRRAVRASSPGTVSLLTGEAAQTRLARGITFSENGRAATLRRLPARRIQAVARAWSACRSSRAANSDSQLLISVG